MEYAPSKNKLYRGDYIKKIDGKDIVSKKQFIEKINQGQGESVILTVQRKAKMMQIKIKPERSKTDHMYKIGTWIRDNTQGIGTMTYVKGTSFGGLGHGIYDMDTGTLLKIKGGLLLDPQIYSIKKGKSGGVIIPQMNKGGKFIFGKSLIRTDGTLRIPPQAMEEYHIADEGKVYLFTGSKITGGFCVTRKGLLHPSKLGHILDDTPPLLDYSAGSGEFIKYKGRSYCWVEISQEGQILLTKKMMDFLKVRPGMELLSIRSSDIAFTMGAKGPLLEKAENYDGEIPLF